MKGVGGLAEISLFHQDVTFRLRGEVCYHCHRPEKPQRPTEVIC